MPSDPTIPDRERQGDDLLERLLELALCNDLDDDAPDGWRTLLSVCRSEIIWLRNIIAAIRESCDEAGPD